MPGQRPADLIRFYLRKRRCEDSNAMRYLLKSRYAKHILRKEVIQPLLPKRLPCYDFTPVIDPTVVRCLRS